MSPSLVLIVVENVDVVVITDPLEIKYLRTTSRGILYIVHFAHPPPPLGHHFVSPDDHRRDGRGEFLSLEFVFKPFLSVFLLFPFPIFPSSSFCFPATIPPPLPTTIVFYKIYTPDYKLANL